MNHRHQPSTTAAADGLQLGSGLRRIACLAALLFIFVAGVRAQYPITETAFPDKYFYKVVLEKYSMYNGSVFVTNPGVTSMEVKSLTIRDLTGIGLFPLLQTLDCSNNQLRSADLQYNIYLTTVTIYRNRLYGTGMDKFIDNLFDRSQQPTKGELRIIYNENASTGNKMTSAQVEAAKKRGWTPKMSTNGTTWTDYPGSDAIAINSTNFPDENFREWLLEQSYGKDGYLSTPEIAAVTKIDVYDKSISSLKGIEYFTALEYLYCHDNQLKSLDVSKNTALIELACDNNQLTSLDVSKNTALEYLYCRDNQLTSLDVSKNTALKMLFCENNKLTALDVSNCTELADLWCFNNLIRGKGMTDLVNSLPDWKSASGKGDMFVYRDETPAGNLMTPKQVEVATSKNWSVLRYDADNWKWVDYEGEPADGIEISEENFPDENFREYVGSKTIDKDEDGYLSDDEIAAAKEIDVNNKGISDLTGIEYFVGLEYLLCHDNNLTTLNVSKNKVLQVIYCWGNQIRGEGMKTLVNSLHSNFVDNDWPEVLRPRLIVIKANEAPVFNRITEAQVEIATEKGWAVKKLDFSVGEVDYEGEPADGIEISEENFPDENFREYVGSKTIDKDEDGYLSDDEIAAATKIDVYDKSISSLKGIEYFTALTYLDCQYNNLTTLDVSGCTALEELNCHGNQLTTLDVSNNTALTELHCDYNGLTELDVSNNTALIWLSCVNNQMISLDVTNCTALTKLNCQENQLKSLDVSGCTALKELYCHSNLIRGKGMTDLVKSLPDRSSASEKGELQVNWDETPAGNLMTPGQVEIAKSMNWSANKYHFGVGMWVPYGGETVPGDATGDGEVDALDVDCLRDYILGLDPQPFSLESANLNGDSAVDIQDLTQLIEILLKR